MSVLSWPFPRASCQSIPHLRTTTLLTLCAVSLLCALPGLAADFYVSNSGSDDNSGIAPTAAWRSLTKVNSFGFAPGDAIHFECGSQ